MKTNYNVSQIKVKKVKELPDSWSKQDYLDLLEDLDVDDVETLSESDMHEMLVMALQDKELIPAAETLLNYRLGNTLDSGDIQYLSQEYLETELWDEHADMSLHKELFNIGMVLHDAFSSQMTEPVCANVSFKLQPIDNEAEEELKKGDIASLLIRVLADGMDENAKLNRLFEDQIKEAPFPEAKSILWKIDKTEQNGSSEVELFLSYEWVKDFPVSDSYESTAFADD